MIELPGSFSGIDSSPRPQRGPLASQRMSLAIFIRLAATVFSAPCANTSASAAAITSNLFGAVTNGRPVSLPIAAATFTANSRMRVQPRADRGAAERELVQMRQRRFDVAHALVELRDVARKLLAERERRRVLQVRAADLHDVVERLRLLVERIAQRLQRRHADA